MLLQRHQENMAKGLLATDDVIARLFEERERELSSLSEFSTHSADALRSLRRNSPTVTQFFVLDSRGELTYPNRDEALSLNEDAFLRRTEDLWLRHDLLLTADHEEGRDSRQGWYTWYRGSGLNFIFWWRDETGTVVGAELNRARLLADIISELPATDFAGRDSDGTMELVNSNGDAIYRWGTFEILEGEYAFSTLALSAPVSAWRLDYYFPFDKEVESLFWRMILQVFGGLALLAVALMGLSLYFYREQSRDLREAGQRVDFVNQVSHELKTPLTNIRMYAELLEDLLGETDEQSRSHLGVIVSESQRLSRLIGNVLSFSRGRRNTLNLHASPGVVDDTLRSTVQHFEPALEKQGIRVVLEGNAPAEMNFDRDALEQILGNLLNNVEKYAKGADRVELTSEQTERGVAIVVHDDGPGVAIRERIRIFEPFHRVSNKLTDGVAGTGIGLSIARDLARLHGGDLTLEDSTHGACFKLTLASLKAVSEETQ